MKNRKNLFGLFSVSFHFLFSTDVDVISGPVSSGGHGGGSEFEFETHPRPGRPNRPNIPDSGFGSFDPTDVFFRPVFHNPFFNSFGLGGGFNGLFPGFDIQQTIPWWKG